MLAELCIDDLVLIAAARLEFSPGLNVITGETGAGKTLLAQAIGLLMGQKGGDELVRPGADRALVQALFESGEDELAVARELPRGGRSRARIDGLLSCAAAVEEALRERLAFYGQLEHTRLLQLERQLDLLDGAVADEVEPLRGGATPRRTPMRARSPASWTSCAGPAATASASSTCCASRSTRSRRPLWSPARTSGSPWSASGRGTPASCSSASAAPSTLLAGETEAAALDGVRVAQRLVDEAALLDEALAPVAQRLGALTAELDDLAAVLRDYLDDARRRPGAPRRPRAALRQAEGADAQVRRLGRRGPGVRRGGRRAAGRAGGVRRRRGVAGGQGHGGSAGRGRPPPRG